MTVTVSPNGVYEFICDFTADPEDAGDPAINWRVEGCTDTRTSISNAGVLKLGPAEAGPLTIVAAWRDDDGTDNEDTLEVSVDPEGKPYWPNKRSAEDALAIVLTTDGSTPVTEVEGGSVCLALVTVVGGGELPESVTVTSEGVTADISPVGVGWQVSVPPVTKAGKLTLTAAAPGYSSGSVVVDVLVSSN